MYPQSGYFLVIYKSYLFDFAVVVNVVGVEQMIDFFSLAGLRLLPIENRPLSNPAAKCRNDFRDRLHVKAKTEA